MKDGKKLHITAPKESPTTAAPVTATQPKTTINDSMRYTLLAIGPEQQKSVMILLTLTLSPQQQTDIGKLQEEYNVLLQGATRIPPKRS